MALLDSRNVELTPDGNRFLLEKRLSPGVAPKDDYEWNAAALFCVDNPCSFTIELTWESTASRNDWDVMVGIAPESLIMEHLGHGREGYYLHAKTGKLHSSGGKRTFDDYHHFIMPSSLHMQCQIEHGSVSLKFSTFIQGSTRVSRRVEHLFADDSPSTYRSKYVPSVLMRVPRSRVQVMVTSAFLIFVGITRPPMGAGESADAVFECQGRDIPAHTRVLGDASPVFKAMFDSPMREGQERPVSLRLDDADPDALEQLVHFLHVGAMDRNTNLPAVLALMDEYMIDDTLVHLCVEPLLARLTEQGPDVIADVAGVLHKRTHLTENSEHVVLKSDWVSLKRELNGNERVRHEVLSALLEDEANEALLDDLLV